MMREVLTEELNEGGIWTGSSGRTGGSLVPRLERKERIR